MTALVRLAGPVTTLREPEHGPFRQLRRRPEDVRAELADAAESSGDAEFSPGTDGNVLAYATRRPLNKRHIGQLRHYAGQLERAPARAAPGLRARRDRDPAGGAGPRGPGGQAASSGRHAGGPRAARAA